MHKKNWKYLTILLAGIVAVPFLAYAATSTNFDATQDSAGPVNGSGASANYEYNVQVGHPGVGISTSSNYTYWHGTFWDDESTSTAATIQWAIPEMRVNATTTNEDALFYLVVKDPITHAVMYTMPFLATTTLQGTYPTPLELGVDDGTYDIGIKTHQHLTSILRNVNLTGATVLNFTAASNTSPFGPDELLAGDISGATSSPAVLGDDVVNSVDISIMIGDLDRNDVTNRGIRANLNQDPVVNSVDLSLMLKNLDVNGEE